MLDEVPEEVLDEVPELLHAATSSSRHTLTATTAAGKRLDRLRRSTRETRIMSTYLH